MRHKKYSAGVTRHKYKYHRGYFLKKRGVGFTIEAVGKNRFFTAAETNKRLKRYGVRVGTRVQNDHGAPKIIISTRRSGSSTGIRLVDVARFWSKRVVKY